jgi:predicted PurR-regulated permease PerM
MTTAQRLWLGAGLLALVFFLYLVRETLPPFLIALTAAALLDPLLDRMQRRGWSRRSAVIVVFAIFLLVFAGVALILIPAAVRQATDLVGSVPSYYEALAKRFQALLGSQQDLLGRLHLPTSSSEILEQYQAQITRVLQTMLSRLLQFFGASVSKLVWVAIIPIVTFYLMLEIDPLRARVVHLVPQRHQPRFLELSERVGAVFSGYVRGLIIVCAGYAVVTGVLLAVFFRLPYSLMIGLTAGVLYAVPYVGAIATVAIGGLVATASHPSTGYVVGVVLTMLAINQVFDQLITPRVVGGLVGLHPVVSLFALTTGGQLFGLPGMILAVPVAASIKVLLVSVWPQISEPLAAEELEGGAADEALPLAPEETVTVLAPERPAAPLSAGAAATATTDPKSGSRA